jgi:hypothetical protein
LINFPSRLTGQHASNTTLKFSLLSFLAIVARYYYWSHRCTGPPHVASECHPEDLNQICTSFDFAWNFVVNSRPAMFPDHIRSRAIFAVKIFGLAKTAKALSVGVGG